MNLELELVGAGPAWDHGPVDLRVAVFGISIVGMPSRAEKQSNGNFLEVSQIASGASDMDFLSNFN